MSRDTKVGPKDVDAARAEIERTRARMSETIDDIEDTLMKKKEQIQERLDFVARIREDPLPAAGLMLGIGLLLGLLTGGGKGGVDQDEFEEAEERAALWEDRARRLLAIARAQQEDLDDIEEAVSDNGRIIGKLARSAARSRNGSRASAFAESASERLTDAVGGAARSVVEGVRRRL